MAFLKKREQPKVAAGFVQAAAATVALAAVFLAGGCTDIHNSGPEAWWHEQIGGKIAEQRPPPPGAKDPYPNLATVPPRPPPPNAATWNDMTTALMTDRIRADEAAALAPIPTPVPPRAGVPAGSPAAGATTTAGVPPGLGTTASPAAPVPSANQSAGASAALVGASPSPGAAPRGTAPAPSGHGKSAAGGTMATPASPAQPLPELPARQTPLPTVAEEAAHAANGPLPPLPTNPPARPGIAPAPPPPAVPATAAAPVVSTPPTGTQVDFSARSAVLSDMALRDVAALALARGDHGIAITGFGDVSRSDAISQSEALDLATRRAQVLAGALVARGVPFAFLRLRAEAAGRGANLRLLE